MIYSHKTDTRLRNLSREEKQKLKKLEKTKPTAWMVDSKQKVQ